MLIGDLRVQKSLENAVARKRVSLSDSAVCTAVVFCCRIGITSKKVRSRSVHEMIVNYD
jgi:hypothetical protein